MEDWNEKLVEAVRPYLDEGNQKSFARREQIRAWLDERDLLNVRCITSAQHAVELMELIDRWHDEDAANKACTPPEQPDNPFIEETVQQTIRLGTIGIITVKGFNFEFINIAMPNGPYMPGQLRTLAKHLTDLADAHETIYPPNHCATAC